MARLSWVWSISEKPKAQSGAQNVQVAFIHSCRQLAPAEETECSGRRYEESLMQWASSQAAEEKGEVPVSVTLRSSVFPQRADSFRADSPWLTSEPGCDNTWAQIWAIAGYSGVWAVGAVTSLATFCMKILSWLMTNYEICIDALLTPSNWGAFAYCFEEQFTFSWISTSESTDLIWWYLHFIPNRHPKIWDLGT